MLCYSWTGIPDEGDLSIFMREYSTKEVISLCQRFVTSDDIITEEQQEQDCESTDDTEKKEEGTVSENVPNFCTICRKSFVNRKLYMVHVYQSHPKSYNYECTSCRKKFAHKFQLSKHFQLCHSKLSFVCEFKHCVKLYKSKKALLLHIKKKHS